MFRANLTQSSSAEPLPLPSRRQRRREPEPVSTEYDATLSTLQRITESSTRHASEFDSFGHTVAENLKSISMERAVVCMDTIHRLLSSHRLAHIRNEPLEASKLLKVKVFQEL